MSEELSASDNTTSSMAISDTPGSENPDPVMTIDEKREENEKILNELNIKSRSKRARHSTNFFHNMKGWEGTVPGRYLPYHKRYKFSRKKYEEDDDKSMLMMESIITNKRHQQQKEEENGDNSTHYNQDNDTNDDVDENDVDDDNDDRKTMSGDDEEDEIDFDDETDKDINEDGNMSRITDVARANKKGKRKNSLYVATYSWTPKDDKRLIKIVSMLPKKDWIKIAQLFGNHVSPKECCRRYNKDLKNSETKRGWSPEEDEKLKNALLKYGTNWELIATFTPDRSAKQCRNRWHNALKAILEPEIQNASSKGNVSLGKKLKSRKLLMAHRPKPSAKRNKDHISGNDDGQNNIIKSIIISGALDSKEEDDIPLSKLARRLSSSQSYEKTTVKSPKQKIEINNSSIGEEKMKISQVDHLDRNRSIIFNPNAAYEGIKNKREELGKLATTENKETKSESERQAATTLVYLANLAAALERGEI